MSNDNGHKHSGIVDFKGREVGLPTTRRPALVDSIGRPIFRADYVRNPMLDFPGHLPCFCGQDKPARKCCLPKLALKIPPEDESVGRDFIAWVHSQREKRKKSWEVQ